MPWNSNLTGLDTGSRWKVPEYRDPILDGRRGLDWAPRQQRKRSKLIEKAIAHAEQSVCRTANE